MFEKIIRCVEILLKMWYNTTVFCKTICMSNGLPDDLGGVETEEDIAAQQGFFDQMRTSCTPKRELQKNVREYSNGSNRTAAAQRLLDLVSKNEGAGLKGTLLYVEHYDPDVTHHKILSFESSREGQFSVVDCHGRELARCFERPAYVCYVSAHVLGSEGQTIDSFGADCATLEEGKGLVRAFFEKHGFSL